MGFFSRRLVPRKVRRVAHPVRAAKRAVTPKPVKKLLRATNVVRNPGGAALYAAERAIRRQSETADSNFGETCVPSRYVHHCAPDSRGGSQVL